MGEDGLVGSRAIRAAGGTVLTESESSCVVYGMPRAVKEAGLSSGSTSLQGMVSLLGRHVRLPPPFQD
jgi:two-component system chemotaxis response regulator CheB